MPANLLRYPVAAALRAALRTLAVRIGLGPLDSALAPRVSLVGVFGICVVTAVLILSTASSVTFVRLRAGMQAQVSANLALIQAALRGLDRELTALETVASGSCDELRPRLVRASLDSELSRQILVRNLGERAPCGPLASLDADIAAAIERYSDRYSDRSLDRFPDRVLTQTGFTALEFEPIPGALPGSLPGLLAIRASAAGGVLVSQIDLKRVATLIGAHLGGSSRSAQLSLIQGGSYRLSPSVDQTVLSSGPIGGPSDSRPVATVRAADPVFPITLVMTLSLPGFAAELWPMLFPSLALAAALAALLIARLNTRLAHRASPETRLRRAVRRRQFEPVVQPIVDAKTGRCLGAEVLMRWDHPVRGLVAPSEFIGQAEQTGLIIPMTQMLMRKARDRLSATLKEFPDLYFSFNVTVSQLADPGFPASLDRLFDEQSLPPRNVVLEMIERDAVDAGVSAGLKELRRRGYRIAIDDFGTGQSSLSVLAKIDCDRLKIDREFVRSIDEDAASRPVLDAIIDLARRLELPTIAEGVETQAQRAYLSAQGVSALQGYLIARPMPIAEFVIWLGDNNAWARSADEARRVGQLTQLSQADAG
jgi:EAL domain-containing protein (putative c-di-GMP-specific phosphodiesterase class I)